MPAPPPQPVFDWDYFAHRPLLWIAPAVMLGCAAGAWLTANLLFQSRNTPALFVPLVIGLLSATWLYRGLPTRFGRLLALCCLLLGCSTTLAARRWLPPTGDAASLVRLVEVPRGPIQRVAIEAQGWVAGDPGAGDYDTGFPMQLDRLAVLGLQAPHRPAPLANEATGSAAVHGKIWVTVPPGTDVRVGDGIIILGNLEDLPHAGNFAERSPEWFYIERGCWCQVRLLHASDMQVARPGDRYPAMRAVAKWRRELLAHYVAAFTGPDPLRPMHPYPRATAQLLAAIVFGHGGLSEPLPQLLQDEFRAAGMAHVLVASGTQVVFLGVGLLLLARLCGLRRWWLLAFLAPVLLGYALIAGGGSSIWRATLCGLAIVWAMHLGRDTDGLSLWALGCATILLLDPLQLFDIGFQLTFGATWGILAFSGALHRRLAAWLGAIPGLSIACMSLAAQACTIPLTMHHFGTVSAAGVLASSIAIPLSGVLVGTGVLGLFVPGFNALNYPLTNCIERIAAIASGARGSHAAIAPLPLVWVGAVFLALLLLLPPWVANSPPVVEARDWTRRTRERLIAGDWQTWARSSSVGLAIALAAWITWSAAAGIRRQVRVTLLDVGQGECIVIRAPTGRTVLIDGGSSADVGRGELSRSVIIPYLRAIGVHRIDAMIVTHADADHCNALPDVVGELPVGMMLDGGQDRPAGETEYKLLKTALLERGIPIVPAREGQKLDLGDGATMQVLAPTLPLFPDDNDNGAVVRLDYGLSSVLFAADIEAPAEERLVRRGANLSCTILKVGHHGSRTSSSSSFLDSVHPHAAILSCGRYNSFGHPAPMTLESLRQKHIPVYRTDANGSIDVNCDGRICQVQPFRGTAQ